MKEEFFTEEVNEVLSEINDYSQTIYEYLIYLHNMTGWSYGEIVDKVSRNCDYYCLADIIRVFADAEIKQEQKGASWNEVCREGDFSF